MKEDTLQTRVAEREEGIEEKRSGLSDTKRAMLQKLMRAKAAKLSAEEPSQHTIPRRPRHEAEAPAALSFGQERLWFLDRLQPGTYLYNVTIALRLEGRIDLDALQRSLTEVRRRHEVLRATFPEIDGSPKQVVTPPAPVPLPVADLRALPGCRLESETLRVIELNDRLPFDLERGPMMRSVLARLGESSWALLLLFHHIACDGWSFGVLMRELSILYPAFAQGSQGSRGTSRGTPSPLPELPIQYADYAEWQRQRLQGDALTAEIDWWRRELDGAPTSLELPSDRPRPAVPTMRGENVMFSLAPEVGIAMTALRQQEGATSFMLLLAVFQTLLGRYSGQDDLLVGSPITDRPRPETEALIGFFVNMLVLRARLAGPRTFRELLARTRETVLGAFAHQEVPFEKLADELEQERDLTRNALFQVSFSLLNTPGSNVLELPGLTMAPIEFEATAAKFDLTLGLGEIPDGGLEGGIQYNADLFDPVTVERLLGHFRNLLDGVLAGPDRSLEEISLLSKEERHQLLTQWGDHTGPFDHTPVYRLFERHAARNPEALAVAFFGEDRGEDRLSYGELDRRADRVANRLRRLGVGPEVLVAVCLERSPGLVIAVLGVLKSGGAYLPLDPSNPLERLSYTLRDSGASLLLTNAEMARSLAEGVSEGVRLTALTLDAIDGEADAESDARLESTADPRNLAYVIYTSGSTGNPKGTELWHASLSNLVSWHRRAYGLAPADRCTLLAGPGFDASVWELWPVLVSGASLHIPPADIVASPPDLWSWMAARAITVSFLPTPLAEAVLGEPVPEGLALRALLTGGDRLLRRPRPEHPFVLVNHYGPTESTVVTTAESVAVEGDRPPTIGQPIANLRTVLRDPSFRLVPVGVTGELCIGGQGLARGYRGRPRLTAEKFVPDPFGIPGSRLYRTGDLARLLPSGQIEFVGRIDHQVKIRGFRVELGEIEASLIALPGVREAVVLALEDGGGKRLVAYVAPQDLSPSDLRDALATRLPAYMVPAAFVVLDALPINTSGKVDRKALAAIRPEIEEDGRAAASLTPTEEMLAGVWSELLGVERIGPQDDFFELGGHSLLATRLVSRLRDTFDVELPLRAVFQTSTLSALAGRIAEAVRESRGVQPPPVVPLSAEERGPRPPLSFAQERLWFLDRLEPGSVLYNVPAALRVTGTPHLPALEAALNEIVRRHEALRTTFDQHEGEAFQVIAPEMRVPVPLVDFTALPAELREDEINLRLGQAASQPFDLTHGPLLRAMLFRADREDWAMLLNLHHIVSDGWSMGTLTAEMTTLYESFLEGRPSPLPPLPVQYADFAIWQRRWLQGDVLGAQVAYWKERLQGVRTVLDLPTDRPRPPVQSFHGGHRPLDIPAPLPEALRLLSRKAGTTLFMTLLAGFQTVLHRYTGQEDILVGSPVANRTRREIEGLIGFFVNTLVLRGELRSASPRGGVSFGELLGRVRAAALGAYVHQDLPFERLVDELKIERSLARNPVFQVVFSLNTPARPLELPGLTLAPLGAEGSTAKVDLHLSVTEEETGLRGPLAGSWEYSADLFDPATIDRLSGHLRTLLAAAAADPDRPVSELPLLDDAEARQILVEWNPVSVQEETVQAETGVCLHQLFEPWAERRPGAVAVVFDGRTLTYGELDARSEILARRLRGLGIGPEVLVGICLERGIERIVAVLGVFKAGGAYVPLDPSHPRDRLAWMLADSRARVLITQTALLESLPEHEAHVLLLDREELGIAVVAAVAAVGERVSTLSGSDPDQLAYVIYTSGSTGRPNGVPVRHRSAVNLIRRAVEHFAVGAESRLLQSVSFSFDASVLETWTALSSGAVLCVARQETLLSGEALADMIRRDGITTAILTPSVLTNLPPENLPTLRVVSVGGESCPGELASRWAPPNGPLDRLLNCYGPTETTIYTTVHVCRGTYRKEPPIGRAVPGARAYLLDFHGQPMPAGVPGALWIGGVGLARGYLNRPELTAERFAPDPFASAGEDGGRLYRTGDLARWTPEGRLEFLGRIDRQVKVRGLRIELGEIEGALGSHPRLRECAVLVREDRQGGKRLSAYVVAALPGKGEEDLPPLVSQDLREHLRSRLPDYMVPSTFAFLEDLPRTPTDKLDRDALLRLDTTDEPEAADRVAPRDLFELELVRIWSEVLGVPSVSVRDNFFDAGGHSLLAVRLMAQIQQRFGRELPLSILFQGGTVEEMAARLREGSSEEPSSLVPIQPGGSRPPLFCVHPAGGDVLCFAALARHLGPDQPFYGFQSRGLAGPAGTAPLERVEDMAAHYIQEMRRAQPEGPYRIAGWSLGGVVAFQMARQLREQGEQVALLGVLDSVPDLTAEAAGFHSDIDFLLDMAAYVEALWGKSLGLTREALEELEPDAQLACLVERLRGADFLPPGAGVEQLGRILRVYKANAAAAGTYQPRPYPGGMTLFRAADMPALPEGVGGPLSEPDFGWSRVVQGPVEVRPVPGQHLTILAEPYVQGLARELERVLEGVSQEEE